jgi:hypothetical protein
MAMTLVSFAILTTLLATLAIAQEEQYVTEKNIQDDVNSFVCKKDDRLEAARKLFKNAGAGDSDLQIISTGKVDNLVVTHRGASDETIVVGAHYDKVSAGCGVLDNWTGVVIVANLYRYLSHFKTKKTFVFVAFDREEEGLYGSHAFANAIPKDKRSQYCSMVNFDSFGFGYPQVMLNASTPLFAEYTKKLAESVKMPFHEAAIAGAGADSASFRAVGIPAITLHGMGNDWQKYLHTSNDNIKNVNVNSVLVGYNFGVLLLSNVDAQPCHAFLPSDDDKQKDKQSSKTQD